MKSLIKNIYGKKPTANTEIAPSVSELPIVAENLHDPVFFAHIPKTAGTSFKRAAIEFYGDERVIKNYGEKSIETSQLTRSTLLKNTNIAKFKRELIEQKIQCYMGHVHFNSARHAFDCTQLVTFLRDPVEQVVSHFNHYKRWHGYEGVIQQFIETLGFRNVQSRFLKGIPRSILGLVGITERFSESLEIYNRQYGVNLLNRSDNVNEKRDVVDIDDHLRVQIIQNNAIDFDLYNRVKDTLQQRIALEAAGKKWTYGAVFSVNQEKGIVSGVAFKYQQEDPVAVVLSIAGKEKKRCIANHFRPGFAQWNVPNCNHIGFHFEIPEGINLSDTSVHVADTGQELEFDI